MVHMYRLGKAHSQEESNLGLYILEQGLIALRKVALDFEILRHEFKMYGFVCEAGIDHSRLLRVT